MKKAILTLAAVLLLVPAAFAKSGALGLVPADAVSVGVVRIADMRSSPLSAALFQQTDKITTDGDAAKFLMDAGLQPSRDIDVVVVATSPRTALGREAEVLVAAEGRFNVDRLSSALVTRGARKVTGANGSYLLLAKEGEEKHGAVAFPNSGLVLVGTESAVLEALGSYAAGGTSFSSASGLGHDMGRIDPKATAWAIVDVTRAQRLAGSPHISSDHSSAKALNGALKNVSTIAMWATDTGDSLKLGAVGLSGDGETLQLLEDTVRGALAAMRLAVQEKQPDLVSVLRKFTVSRSDDSISISGYVPADTFREYAKKAHSK
jgi:hypothetical protein